MSRLILRNAFEYKIFKDGFNKLTNSNLNLFDIFSASISLAFYHYRPNKWKMIETCVEINCELTDQDCYTDNLEPYVMCHYFIDYLKMIPREKFDIIVYEGIYHLCLRNMVDVVKKIIDMSVNLFRSVRFDLYQFDLIRICEDLELDNMVDLMLLSIQEADNRSSLKKLLQQRN